MPSWVRSRPTISSSLLSSWTVMMRSFGSSNSCSFYCWCVVCWFFWCAVRAVCPLVVVRPEMLRIMAGMDQWGYFSGMDYAGFTGDPTPRAVSSASGVFHCRSRRRHWQWYVLAGFAGYDTPRAVFFDVAIPQVQSLSRFTCLWLWLVFLPDSA